MKKIYYADTEEDILNLLIALREKYTSNPCSIKIYSDKLIEFLNKDYPYATEVKTDDLTMALKRAYFPNLPTIEINVDEDKDMYKIILKEINNDEFKLN